MSDGEHTCVYCGAPVPDLGPLKTLYVCAACAQTARAAVITAHTRPAPPPCSACGRAHRIRNVRYDAYYCTGCYRWLERGCDGPGCVFCVGRPSDARGL